MDNKELELERKKKEQDVYTMVITHLTHTEEGKAIISELDNKIEAQTLTSSIKMFSLLCSKMATAVEIFCTHDIEEYQINLMVDKMQNVSYLKKIKNLTQINSTPGVKCVSNIPDAHFVMEQKAEINDDVQVIPFYSLKIVENEIINQFIFYIKD